MSTVPGVAYPSTLLEWWFRGERCLGEGIVWGERSPLGGSDGSGSELELAWLVTVDLGNTPAQVYASTAPLQVISVH